MIESWQFSYFYANICRTVGPSRSILIDIPIVIDLLSWHMQIYWGECVTRDVNGVLTWNKFLSAPHHPESLLVPCLEAFLLWPAGQWHPYWYSVHLYTIAAIVLVYWRGKKVCSSGCVWRMHLEQISVSSTQPRKCINTKLGGVHRTISRAAASP